MLLLFTIHVYKSLMLTAISWRRPFTALREPISKETCVSVKPNFAILQRRRHHVVHVAINPRTDLIALVLFDSPTHLISVVRPHDFQRVWQVEAKVNVLYWTSDGKNLLGLSRNELLAWTRDGTAVGGCTRLSGVEPNSNIWFYEFEKHLIIVALSNNSTCLVFRFPFAAHQLQIIHPVLQLKASKVFDVCAKGIVLLQDKVVLLLWQDLPCFTSLDMSHYDALREKVEVVRGIQQALLNHENHWKAYITFVHRLQQQILDLVHEFILDNDLNSLDNELLLEHWTRALLVGEWPNYLDQWLHEMASIFPRIIEQHTSLVQPLQQWQGKESFINAQKSIVYSWHTFLQVMYARSCFLLGKTIPVNVHVRWHAARLSKYLVELPKDCMQSEVHLLHEKCTKEQNLLFEEERKLMTLEARETPVQVDALSIPKSARFASAYDHDVFYYDQDCLCIDKESIHLPHLESVKMNSSIIWTLGETFCAYSLTGHCLASLTNVTTDSTKFSIDGNRGLAVLYSTSSVVVVDLMNEEAS